ncbi:MAG: hypothetical protein K2W95_24700 [Candidatus Obscuribacterales bacterium]|nr:hypothetical protein [Candidatus Obscuribacterales bacterium]
MILAQLLLALWFVLAHFGATVAITVSVLVCWPLCSFMGAVVGTTTMRAVFGRTTPGEADFEAGGTIFGGSVRPSSSHGRSRINSECPCG